MLAYFSQSGLSDFILQDWVGEAGTLMEVQGISLSRVIIICQQDHAGGCTAVSACLFHGVLGVLGVFPVAHLEWQSHWGRWCSILSSHSLTALSVVGLLLDNLWLDLFSPWLIQCFWWILSSRRPWDTSMAFTVGSGDTVLYWLQGHSTK